MTRSDRHSGRSTPKKASFVASTKVFRWTGWRVRWRLEFHFPLTTQSSIFSIQCTTARESSDGKLWISCNHFNAIESATYHHQPQSIPLDKFKWIPYDSKTTSQVALKAFREPETFPWSWILSNFNWCSKCFSFFFTSTKVVLFDDYFTFVSFFFGIAKFIGKSATRKITFFETLKFISI